MKLFVSLEEPYVGSEPLVPAMCSYLRGERVQYTCKSATEGAGRLGRILVQCLRITPTV
jgi:hypothetical protein